MLPVYGVISVRVIETEVLIFHKLTKYLYYTCYVFILGGHADIPTGGTCRYTTALCCYQRRANPATDSKSLTPTLTRVNYATTLTDTIAMVNEGVSCLDFVLTPAVGRTLWFLWHRKLRHIKPIFISAPDRASQRGISTQHSDPVRLNKIRVQNRTPRRQVD